jgi:hypothetical protein
MKKLLIRIGIVAGVIVVILLAIDAYFIWTNGARLDAQLAELRAAGEPTSLEDLTRPPIPPEKNAATYLRRAEKDIESIHEPDIRQSMDGVRVAMAKDRAMVRALRVLNAVQIKAAPDAKEPPKLSDLGLPPEVTVDPFNGQPLHVKRLPQGWLVYSVGQNLIDDGGDIESQADIGVGPPAPQETADRK